MTRATPTQGERADFKAFCRNASDQQLRAIYDKETAAGRIIYADIAQAEAARRGVDIRR